jgi:hypothetical protein
MQALTLCVSHAYRATYLAHCGNVLSYAWCVVHNGGYEACLCRIPMGYELVSMPLHYFRENMVLVHQHPRTTQFKRMATQSSSVATHDMRIECQWS